MKVNWNGLWTGGFGGDAGMVLLSHRMMELGTVQTEDGQVFLGLL